MSPRVRIHGSESQGVAARVAPITLTDSDPLEEFVLLVSAMLGSVSLKVLVPKGRILPSEDTARDLLNYELWLPLGHSGIPVSRCQQARRGVIILAGGN